MVRTNRLLIICGPTATGKTDVAVQAAKTLGGELISADSRQVYRGMDIGTGKDREKIDVPIWMLDIVNPNEEFSVSHWVTLAKKAIIDIQRRQKLPIVVGGTGLYIQALIEPLETIHIGPNKKLRERLQKASIRQLQDMIAPAILETMNRSDKQNPRRLVRRIEITRAKKTHPARSRKFDYLMIGLTAPLPILFNRIDRRVDDRLKRGMEREVAALVNKYGRDIPSMSALGYRTLKNWKRDEHAYAKRQLTWFRKRKDIAWFDVTDQNAMKGMTERILSWYTQVDS